jgi:hypothetical protein
LDKSPRYHFVVDDLCRIFPDAKLIFLWRNPLAVVASALDTWAGGRWSLHRFHVDLYDGLARLVSASDRLGSQALNVRYEDLVERPEESWPLVFEYLDLTFDARALSLFPQVVLSGRMGDPTGVHSYRSVSVEPIDKWRQSLANPFRKAWAHRYLEWIGPARLATMGYRMEDLTAEVDSLRFTTRLLTSDLARSVYGRSRRGAASLAARIR